VIIASLALAACVRNELSGPPELRPGRDECHECGMIINEDRFAAALLVEDRGRREHLLFDDIGCMLDSERAGLAPRTVLLRFVHDHDSRAWVDAQRASFVFADADAVHTPMGSGILAFAGADAAKETQGRLGGEVMNLEQLARAREEWMVSRYGEPGR
jgi:nitrous oxide reductase accessory protein NosL